MATDITHQRCYNHGRREAAARCPECGRYYCRECVTEHEGRVLCASCLVKLTGAGKKKRSSLTFLVRLGQVVMGLILAWMFFYVMGQGLLALPTSFHEGTIWKEQSL